MMEMAPERLMTAFCPMMKSTKVMWSVMVHRDRLERLGQTVSKESEANLEQKGHKALKVNGGLKERLGQTVSRESEVSLERTGNRAPKVRRVYPVHRALRALMVCQAHRVSKDLKASLARMVSQGLMDRLVLPDPLVLMVSMGLRGPRDRLAYHFKHW